MHQGRRLGHILDPRTGWPVEGGPASVTVAAGSCIEAGTLATLALLQGAGASSFLQRQGVQFWCQPGA
jgi:thiamine biosynthesis lipoprotein